jgi:hypothetical protein
MSEENGIRVISFINKKTLFKILEENSVINSKGHISKLS